MYEATAVAGTFSTPFWVVPSEPTWVTSQSPKVLRYLSKPAVTDLHGGQQHAPLMAVEIPD